MVFSTTDRASFEALDSWKRKVEDECGPIVMALVQNKVRRRGYARWARAAVVCAPPRLPLPLPQVDLLDEAKMTPAEVEAAARRLGVRLYRTCVKDNVNVSEVFDYLATQVCAPCWMGSSSED
jgi:Ras-related protein Rab-23